MVAEDNNQTPKKKNKSLFRLIMLIVILAGIWFLVRPGVFTIQPIGALPEGITFIYHSRSPEMPFFASPDGMCLIIEGSVSLLCRLAGLSALEELTSRIITRVLYFES